MITIDEQTLKELVLRTEPGFLTQQELKMNGFGSIMEYAEESEGIWIWSKERVRSASAADLNYLITKIIE